MAAESLENLQERIERALRAEDLASVNKLSKSATPAELTVVLNISEL